MSKVSSLKHILFVSSVILILHLIGLKFYYYWQFDWYDHLVHYIAGFLIAFMVYHLFFIRKTPAPFNLLTGIYIILGTFIVGIGWEFFEIYIGAASVTVSKYVMDTWWDVTMDLLGAGMAVLYLWKAR